MDQNKLVGGLDEFLNPETILVAKEVQKEWPPVDHPMYGVKPPVERF